MPGTLQLIQVGKTPQRIQTILVSNDSFMLVNPDITNNIFIGNDPGNQIIAVPALGSVTLDASKHDIWVSTNGGAYTVNAYLMPNGSNWVPSPAQVAAQINALGLAKDTTLQTTNTNTSQTATNTTGVAKDATLVTTNTNTSQTATNVSALTTNGIPPLRGTDNFGSATGQTIATGVNATLVNGNTITKPGFEGVFSISIPAGVGTAPFAVLQLIWQDSATGLQVGLKQYILSSGNGPANVLTYYLSGPCRGNQIILKLRNQDPAQTLTVTWAFNQTSHTYLTDRLLQATYAATPPITFQNPAGNPSKGILVHTQPTIGPNANTPRLTAACNAKCKLAINNSGGLNACSVSFQDPSNLYDPAAANGSFARFTAGASSVTNNEFQMPNGPVNAVISNDAATNTITPQIAITIMEY